MVLLVAALPAWGYIDLPAGRLTLPKLLLEFKPAGVYEMERVDLERGLVRYVLVEALHGSPLAQQKHVLRTGGRIPAEITGVEVGRRVVLMGPDPFGRGLAFVNGAWYVSNYERAGGWWRIEYTSAHYDFRCAFAGDLPLLVESCKALLDGREVTVPCHAKPKDARATAFAVTLREPGRRAEAAAGARAAPVAARDLPLAEALAALRDAPGWADRLDAARSLGAWPEAAGRSAPALVAALRGDKDAFVRRRAAVALGRLGPAAAAEALGPLLDRAANGYADANDLVGFESWVAARRIDPTGERTLAEIRARVGSATVSVRRHAVRLIGLGGPPATEETVAMLTRAAGDADPDVRYGAAGALERVDAPAGAAVPVLAGLLADKEKDVHDPATRALRALGPAAAAEAAKMLGADRAVGERRAGARVMSALEPGVASGARAALEAALDDADAEVRAGVREVLRGLGKR